MSQVAMAFRRGETPLKGGIPSLEASNQAQIDDLVQRNRTLEHMNKKLAEQLSNEEERSKHAVLAIQQQWVENQHEWKAQCVDILSSGRIAQRHLAFELERERGNVLREMAVSRAEKVQRVQRDFKIKLFQMQEEYLERRAEELEEEKGVLVDRAKGELRGERERCAEYASRLKETRDALTQALKERDEKESKYNKLVEHKSNLEAETDTLETKLQRTQLQLEGSKTKVTELERVNEEVKRTNADLQRQLDKWLSLESKGGEAAEKQHKKIRELEFKLQELQEALEKDAEVYEKELEKEKKRVENMKTISTNWESEAKIKDQQVKDANKQVAKLQKQTDKLKTELESERARVRPLSPQKLRAPTPPPPVDEEVEEAEEGDEEEEEDEAEEVPKKSSSLQSTSKPGPSKLKTTGPFTQIARKSTGGKPPPRRVKKATTPEVVEISDNEVGEEPPPPPTKKRKEKEKGKEKDRSVENEDEDEVEEAPVTQKAKGKRKAVEDDIQIVEKPKSGKRASRAPSEVREAKTRAKPRSRAASKQRVTRPEPEPEKEKDDDDGDGTAPKKKKRKIISAAPGPFAFSSINLGGLDDQINSFNIPSVLSPVRHDELVPQRSTSSSIAGVFGKFMPKISLPGQRKT